MSAPPVPPLPPKPQEARSNATTYPGPPPPLPPLPPAVRMQEQRYNTPSVYELESPPHFENPLIAPRPHRVDRSIPANMARTLDDQVQINFTPGFAAPTPQAQNWNPWSRQQQPQQYELPNPNDLAQSFANLAMAPPLPIPQSASFPQSQLQKPPQQHHRQQSNPPQQPRQGSLPSSEPALPSLTASLPQLAQLQQAAPQIQVPTHDPALQIAWCRDVFFLVDRAVSGPAPATDPPVGPASIPDPALARLMHIAIPLVLQLASAHTQGQGKMPPHVAEAISMRAGLASTGAFPEHIKHNPRTAFRDFEAAARGGFAPAWFRLGRDYENFNDHAHAKECFERGAKLSVESCLYRMGMAHLLGQLSLPASPALALPLLHRAALLSSLNTPQPAYVYALLLLSEFTSAPPIPLPLLAPLIPANSSPTLEARKHLERAAYLHFPAAQYKLGHAYEFAEPPFAFDPLLSVQYYSLASEAGEVEADMALSKWFLCGSGGAALAGVSGIGAEGGFEKDEGLALTFAEKAARRGLPSAEFAMGYYAEVGVGQPRDLGKAVHWYKLANSHGSTDASARLAALQQPAPATLSRIEHENLTQNKLVRRRTQAAARAETTPVSPPWQGTVFPTLGEVRASEAANETSGAAPGQAPLPGQGPAQQRRRRQDPRLVVDVIRKNSLAVAHGSGFATPLGSASQGLGGRMPGLTPSASAAGAFSGRSESPKRNASPQRLPLGPGSGSTPPRRTASPGSGPIRRTESPGHTSAQPMTGLTRLERMRLNLDEPASTPLNSAPYSSSSSSLATPSTAHPATSTPTKGYALTDAPVGSLTTPRPTQALTATAAGASKKPQTFAEMGFHGAKADEKDCVIM